MTTDRRIEETHLRNGNHGQTHDLAQNVVFVDAQRPEQGQPPYRHVTLDLFAGHEFREPKLQKSEARVTTTTVIVFQK